MDIADLDWIMARSLREGLIDELIRLGLSMELIELLFPRRGTASQDVLGQLGRVLRWLAGHIRDQLLGGHRVAAPDVVSQAVEALVGGKAEPQPGPDLIMGPGGVAILSEERLPRYRKRRGPKRKADQACAAEAAQGGAGPEEDQDPDQDNQGDQEGQDEEQHGPEGPE